MVRLVEELQVIIRSSLQSFNSYMVRLVDIGANNYPEEFACFNSYMVRLVVAAADKNRHQAIKFQFLYGAIGGTGEDEWNAETLLFQFLYSAIGGESLHTAWYNLLSFNSYMVRLVEQNNASVLIAWPSFNSYMVRLVAWRQIKEFYDEAGFQFLYGAIGGAG